jgi:tetratricopeptide (TPR) repeat protein
VAFLLDGSVRRAGNALRIVGELIEARSGLSRWSDSFDRQFTDIFAVQAEIAARVATAVLGQMQPAAQKALTAAPGTNSVTAYDLYLKGREQYELDIDESSDRRAVALFDQAIAADPMYANAYAARSAAELTIGGNYVPPAQQKAVYAQALADAQKAAALAPNLAEAQLAIGSAIYGGRLDFRAARPFFDRAHSLGRHNATILELFAYFAAKSGRNSEAEAAINQAVALDPLNPLMVRAQAKILLAAGRLDAAIALLRKALAMNPKLSNTSASIGDALLLQNKLDAARQAYRAEPKEPLRLTGEAIVAARLGDHMGATAALNQLVAKYGNTDVYQQAQVAAQWGEIDRAVTLLNRAYAANDSGLTFTLIDPMLRPLAANAGYQALLRKLGLR